MTDNWKNDLAHFWNIHILIRWWNMNKETSITILVERFQVNVSTQVAEK